MSKFNVDRMSESTRFSDDENGYGPTFHKLHLLEAFRAILSLTIWQSPSLQGWPWPIGSVMKFPENISSSRNAKIAVVLDLAKKHDCAGWTA